MRIFRPPLRPLWTTPSYSHCFTFFHWNLHIVSFTLSLYLRKKTFERVWWQKQKTEMNKKRNNSHYKIYLLIKNKIRSNMSKSSCSWGQALNVGRRKIEKKKTCRKQNAKKFFFNFLVSLHKLLNFSVFCLKYVCRFIRFLFIRENSSCFTNAS